MVTARALLLLALVTLVPGVAAAQIPGPMTPPPVTPPMVSPRTPPPSSIPSAPVVVLPPPTVSTVGPVQTFILRPTIAFSEEYTDNFNRTESGLVSNLRSTIAPGLLVLIDRGFLTGQATYSLSVFHDSSEDAIGYFNNFAGRLSWEATPRIRIDAAYGLSQSDEPGRADRLNLRQERQRFTVNTFSLDATYALTVIEVRPHYRLSHFSSREETNISHTLGVGSSLALDKIHTLAAGYDYLTTETSGERTVVASARGNSSTKGHEVTASISRDLSARASAGLSGSYAARRQTTPDRQSDFTRWSLSIFNNYTLPDKIIMRGNIGVSQLDGAQSSGKPQLTSFSSLSYWFGPALATVTVERGFSETFGEGENFGVVETSGVSASLSYPFTPLVRGLVDVSYRENKFSGEGDSGRSARAGTEETTLGGTVSLSVQLLRWLSSTLEYVYTDTSSSGADRSFTENRVRLLFNAAF
jgi:hypothetical protein